MAHLAHHRQWMRGLARNIHFSQMLQMSELWNKDCCSFWRIFTQGNYKHLVRHSSNLKDWNTSLEALFNIGPVYPSGWSTSGFFYMFCSEKLHTMDSGRIITDMFTGLSFYGRRETTHIDSWSVLLFFWVIFICLPRRSVFASVSHFGWI